MDTVSGIEQAACAAQRFEILSHIFDGDLGPSFVASDNKEKQALGSLQVLILLSLISRSAAGSEAELAAMRSRLTPLTKISHKNLLRIYEIVDAEDGDVAVTEYARGARLSELLGKVSLSTSDVLTIAKQLCAGLIALAQHDLKSTGVSPANITLLRDGGVKINPIGSNLLKTKEISRHPSMPERFLSPENRATGLFGTNDDQYAVGIILTELLEGRKIIHSVSAPAKVINSVWRTARRALGKEPSHPPELLKIVRKMTASSSPHRYGSLQEAANALGAIMLTTDQISRIPAVVDQWHANPLKIDRSGLNSNLFIILMVTYLIGVLCFLNVFGSKLLPF